MELILLFGLHRYDLIYCDYNIRPERFSFSIWVIPIKLTVWMLVLSSISATCLILSLHRRVSSRSSETSSYFLLISDIFDIYSILARQGISSSSKSILSIFPYIFILLSFSATVLLSEYEFFVTAELVVPDVPQKLENPPEIIKNGFILHNIIVPKGTTQIWETLEMDFSRWNISDKLNTSVRELGQDQNDLVKMFDKSKPEFAMIHRGLPHHGVFLTRMVHELVLKGRYNCYLVKNVADKRVIYDNFENSIWAKCKKLMDRVREAGYYNIWERWNELAGEILFSMERRKNNQTESKSKADFISFTNLLSFEIVFGTLLCIAGLIWIVEWVMGSGLTIVECVHSYISLTYVRINIITKNVPM